MRTLTSLRNAPVRAAVRLQNASGDDGMATAEYAVATVAAAGFGGILWKVLSDPEVLKILLTILKKALNVSFT